MKTEVELISPKIAEAYLARNLKNRRVRKATVQEYAREMEHGRWHLTHQGIAFNDNGDLVDGQHRLKAIVLAGRTIQMNVSRGMKENGDPSAHFIDMGRRRDVGDQLAISTGLCNASQVVAALRQIATICLPGGTKPIITSSIAKEMLPMYAEQIQLILLAVGGCRQARTGKIVGTLAFCMKAYSGVLHFAEGVGSGEMLEANSPELTLRNWIIQPRTGKREFRSDETAQIVACAVRAYLDDKPIKNLQRATKALDTFRAKQKALVEQVANMVRVSEKKIV